jgi:hypothetical protein
MTVLHHGIVDCVGFQVVKSLSWNPDGFERHNSRGQQQRDWGFIICTPSGTAPQNAPEGRELYATIGAIRTDHIEGPCLGILLQGVHDHNAALSRFALACGLSIIEKAKLELGDTIIVAGANPLSHSVLVAAGKQGARAACLVSNSGTEATYLKDIESLTDEVLEYENISSFDPRLDKRIAASRGKTVYIDAAGEPSLVFAMATRVEKFGTLIFCRQEVETSVVMNLREVHHLKSANYIYWGGPETLEEALKLSECCRRADNLWRWKRIVMLSIIH